MSVDHPVVNGSGLVVARVARAGDPVAEIGEVAPRGSASDEVAVMMKLSPGVVWHAGSMGPRATVRPAGALS